MHGAPTSSRISVLGRQSHRRCVATATKQAVQRNYEPRDPSHSTFTPPQPISGEWDLPLPSRSPSASQGPSRFTTLNNQGRTSRAPAAASPSLTPNLDKWARPQAAVTPVRNNSVSDRPGSWLWGTKSEGRRHTDERLSASNSARARLLEQRSKNIETALLPSTGSAASYRPLLNRDSAPHQDGMPSPQRKILYDRRANVPWIDVDERNGSSPAVTRVVTEASQATSQSFDTELFTSQLDHEHEARGSRRDRDHHKSRFSLMSRIGEGVSIPGTSRTQNRRLPSTSMKEKKKSPKVMNALNVDVFIPSVVSVGTLSRLLNVRLETLRRKMVRSGMVEEAAYDHVLTSDYAALLALEFGRNPVVDDEAAFDIYPSPSHPEQASLPSRPPVVTIMGHVDHGKTTLLDTLRSSSIAKGEAGGITQHIGAFSVAVPTVQGSSSGTPRSITFLDTPGHAAFSAMRARGASVTDIVVLVVAADDGVMPQTKEVIELINKDEGNVSVVVAINKVDKPGVDTELVQHALLAEGLQLETFGGDIPCVEVSGLTGHGLDKLVETISAVAEVQDLRAERDTKAHGFVLESRMHRGLGPVATVLLLRGSLKPASHIICGTVYARIRQLTDSSGTAIKIAYPGTAVTVSGWKELPKAGDEVLQGEEDEVKKAVVNRLRKAELESTMSDVDAINNQRRIDRERRDIEEQTGEATAPETKPVGPKELRLVIKGDVSGSVEAVVGALEGIGNNQAVVKVVSTGVGDVTESDIMMAKATEGIVVAFSVSVPRSVEVIAAQHGISMLSSTIIYRLMDDVKERVIALLPPVVEKRVTGEAIVQQIFDIHLKARQIKKVAGCRVTNGQLEIARETRVIRAGQVVHEGSLDALKHHKKDITEAKKGLECGLSLRNFVDLLEGDLIQTFQIVERPGQL